MNLSDWRQFSRALARGMGYYHRLGVPWYALIPRFLQGLISPLFPEKRAAPAEIARRLAICRECPIFDPSLQTCGDGALTLLDAQTGKIVPAGCQCWMPLKVQGASAKCFLAELGREPRW